MIRKVLTERRKCRASSEERARGMSTELAGGCKAIAKDPIGFKVSLCSRNLPYPIHAVGLGLTRRGLRCRCRRLGHESLPPPPATSAPRTTEAVCPFKGIIKRFQTAIHHCQINSKKKNSALSPLTNENMAQSVSHTAGLFNRKSLPGTLNSTTAGSRASC